MVKRCEPIVVAHSGLADKQCVGTRRPPATLTDKTALVWGWPLSVCVCVLGRVGGQQRERDMSERTLVKCGQWQSCKIQQLGDRTSCVGMDHFGPACGTATAIASLTSAPS